LSAFVVGLAFWVLFLRNSPPFTITAVSDTPSFHVVLQDRNFFEQYVQQWEIQTKGIIVDDNKTLSAYQVPKKLIIHATDLVQAKDHFARQEEDGTFTILYTSDYKLDPQKTLHIYVYLNKKDLTENSSPSALNFYLSYMTIRSLYSMTHPDTFTSGIDEKTNMSFIDSVKGNTDAIIVE